MFSNNIKTIALVGGVSVLAFITLSFTGGGLNLAAVITGTDSQVDTCLQELSATKKTLDYQATKTHLNADSKKDIVLKANDETQCGSAGCAHELCVRTDTGVEIIPFGYAAETLVVKDSLSNGMHDIKLEGDSTTNLQWNGTRYTVLE